MEWVAGALLLLSLLLVLELVRTKLESRELERRTRLGYHVLATCVVALRRLISLQEDDAEAFAATAARQALDWLEMTEEEWMHLKRGSCYLVLADGVRLCSSRPGGPQDGAEMRLYTDRDTGALYVREREEWLDGRFVSLRPEVEFQLGRALAGVDTDRIRRSVLQD